MTPLLYFYDVKINKKLLCKEWEEMDEAAIARLVLGILAAKLVLFYKWVYILGYLREEGCRGALKDFLKASRHLQASTFSSSKYVPTRFVGLTLSDILREYYEIYQTGLYICYFLKFNINSISTVGI